MGDSSSTFYILLCYVVPLTAPLTIVARTDKDPRGRNVSLQFTSRLQSYNVRRMPGCLIQLPMASVLQTHYSYACTIMLTA